MSPKPWHDWWVRRAGLSIFFKLLNHAQQSLKFVQKGAKDTL